MAVFFTTDTHFGHGARGLYRRPFASIAGIRHLVIGDNDPDQVSAL